MRFNVNGSKICTLSLTSHLSKYLFSNWSAKTWKKNSVDIDVESTVYVLNVPSLSGSAKLIPWEKLRLNILNKLNRNPSLQHFPYNKKILCEKNLKFFRDLMNNALSKSSTNSTDNNTKLKPWNFTYHYQSFQTY